MDLTCTACPHDYVPDPSPDRPRRCVLPGTSFELEGVHCGADTGLGSLWEANLRMPAIARFPNKIPAGSATSALVSTLDVLPTILSIIGTSIPSNLDGIDISGIIYGKDNGADEERTLFFWRDGFQDGPLGPPYGRFDVAAVKYGRIKAWFSTKSAHYNGDKEQYHDPPLLFDVIADPAESTPLETSQYHLLIERIISATNSHKRSIDWTLPLALSSDPKYLPCVDALTGCRTHKFLESNR